MFSALRGSALAIGLVLILLVAPIAGAASVGTPVDGTPGATESAPATEAVDTASRSTNETAPQTASTTTEDRDRLRPERTGGGSDDGESDAAGVQIADAFEQTDGQTEVIVQFDDVDRGTLRRSDDVVRTLRERSVASSRALDEFARTTQGVSVERDFWITNAALVTVDTDRTPVEALATVEGVERLHPNYEGEYVGSGAGGSFARTAGASGLAGSTTASDLATNGSANATYGLEMIGAPAFWDAHGVSGENATVAVIDSGVNASHSNITLAPDGWAEFDSQGNMENTTPEDPIGHGTHVSGTVAGGAINGTKHFGVAPNASLLVAGSDYDISIASAYASMEWALSHDQDVDVMTASLGFEQGVSALQEPIRNARLAGVVVTAASGNSGMGLVETPGDGYDAISVGAVNSSGEVASFSSSDQIDTEQYWTAPPDGWPAAYDMPFVTAPGVDVCSSVPGNDYDCTYDGTSMATPHVAGAAALLRSMDPSMSGEAIRLRLTQSAVEPDDVTTVEDRRYGSGVVNVTRAAALDVGTIEGTIEVHGEPASNATVYTDQNAFNATASDGDYSVPVTAGNRTVRVSAPGYATVTRTVSASGNGTASLDVNLTAYEPDMEVVDGQPEQRAAGETITTTVSVAGTSSITVTPGEQFTDPANTSLSVAGNASAGYGDEVAVNRSGETINVTTTTAGDYFGTVELNVSSGSGSAETTLTTGPTSVHGDVVHVPQDLPASMGLDQALDVVGTNTTIVLDDGTYEVETDGENAFDAAIVLGDDMTLRAVNGSDPVIEVDDVANALDAVELSGQNATLAGVEVRGDNPSYGVVGVSGEDAVVENVTLREGNIGIDVFDGGSHHLRHTRIVTNDTGVRVLDQALVTSIHNTTIEGATNGIEIAGTVTYAGFNDVQSPDSDGIEVSGTVAALLHNRITDPGDDGILAGGEVSLIENNTVTGGATTAIEVQGTVDEVVGNDVELTAADQQGISLWSVADVDRVSENTVTAPASAAVPIAVDSVAGALTIENNTVRGGDTAIDVNVEEPITIRSNDVRDGRMGIKLQSSGATVNRLVDNRIHNTSANAIWLLGGNGSVIAGNNVTDADHWAIQAEELSNVTVRDNEVAWPGGNSFNWAGVFVLRGSDHLVADNEVDGGHVLVQAVTDTTVRNSTVTASDWGVVVSSYVSVDGTVIRPASNVTTTGTTVTNVPTPVEVTTGVTNATVNHPDAVASFGDDDPAAVTRLTLADGTTISGSGNNVDVGLEQDAVTAPSNLHVVGTALNATATGPDASVTLSEDLAGEPTASLYEETFGFYTDANGSWEHVEGASMTDGVLTATNLSAPATIAAFGEATGSVSGVVRNGSGARIDGATVTLSRHGRTVGTFETNASGEYGGVTPADALNVTVAKPGYSTNETTIAVGENATTAADYTLERLTHYFSVEGLSAPGSTTEGSSYTVTATVENLGTDDGTDTVEYLVDGSVVANETVDVAAGDTATVEFQHALSGTGNHTHAVRTANDATTATLTVEAASDGGGGGGGGGFVPPPPSNPSPEFSITSIDLGSQQVTVGETVSVDVRVDNVGDADGEYTATLTADGETVDSQTLSINSNWHGTATLAASFDEPGTYQLAVGGQSAGTLTVAGVPDLDVANATVEQTEVSPGETVDVTATVVNEGSAEGSANISLVVAGDRVSASSVTVPAGSSQTVTFEHTFETAGERLVAVGGETAGTVTVAGETDSSGSSDGDDSGGDGGMPGFGPVVALLGLLGGGLLATRRATR